MSTFINPYRHVAAGGGIAITISASTDDWVLSAQAEFVAGAQTYDITVNAAVLVGATSNSFAMHLDPDSGSTINLVNNGQIIGKGGLGGDGGASNGDNGDPGSNGGDAIDLTNTPTVVITNGSGEIHGAGGGGGGAGGGLQVKTCQSQPGGDGGGGAGSNAVGNASGQTDPTLSTGELGQTNQAGDGDGGNGGDPAINGTSGEDGCDGGTGASGGNAGKAIDLDGASSPTFISGGSSPQLEGAVS